MSSKIIFFDDADEISRMITGLAETLREEGIKIKMQEVQTREEVQKLINNIDKDEVILFHGRSLNPYLWFTEDCHIVSNMGSFWVNELNEFTKSLIKGDIETIDFTEKLKPFAEFYGAALGLHSPEISGRGHNIIACIQDQCDCYAEKIVLVIGPKPIIDHPIYEYFKTERKNRVLFAKNIDEIITLLNKYFAKVDLVIAHGCDDDLEIKLIELLSRCNGCLKRFINISDCDCLGTHGVIDFRTGEIDYINNPSDIYESFRRFLAPVYLK
ncbi:MAG: hypothetical protein M1338_04775 [Patescibacteria group bacterium]|nr:hypothetical protein [Patescibacteria group bacterium]